MPLWIKYPQENTRRAQYAGSWYDNNPERLRKELASYISSAELSPDKKSSKLTGTDSQAIADDVLALVVPHAGYMFSGATAAYAYNAALKRKPKRIFLLGPSHHVGFRGAALPASDNFATPLGDLKVDKELVEELKTYQMFSVQQEVHRVEHSLELQLPFIKHCFGDIKIVPIVIGQLEGADEARFLGEILKAYVAKDDLVIVSSDFTHYGPRYDYVPFGLSGNFSEQISRMDGRAFGFLSHLDLDGFVDFLRETNDTICGMYPCQVLLSMLPKNSHGSLLKYATSRESHAEDKENSVSYLAIVFSGAQWPESPGEHRPAEELIKLSPEERMSLLTLARRSMEIFVREKRTCSLEELGIEITPVMKECFGVFVTISTKPQKTGANEGQEEKQNNNAAPKDLRGCIGSIYPIKPLFRAIQENAIAACSRDPRFVPVTEDELGNLDLEINVLTPPRRILSYKDIVIGRDGVILSKAKFQAVFLPQVAVEWNWDLNELLNQLALKAGLNSNDWREGASFDVFQSLEFR